MIINNTSHESVDLRESSTPLRSRLEKFKQSISGESNEINAGSKLDDETKQLVIDVLDLLKSSSDISPENRKVLPNTMTKQFDETEYSPCSTETFSIESPGTVSLSSCASSCSSKSSRSSRRKKRTVKLSPVSRKERALQLSPSRGKQRTEKEVGTMKLATPSKRKDRKARSSSPGKLKKDRGTKSSSPSRRKGRSSSRRRKVSSSPSRLRKASQSPGRLKKERREVSTSPKVQEEVLEAETMTKKSQEKSSKKRRGKKPQEERLRVNDEKFNAARSTTSAIVDENQPFSQNTDVSSRDFHIHELNHRQLKAQKSRDALANLARGQGHSHSSDDDMDDDSNPKSPLPRRSSLKSSLRKPRSPTTILAENDGAPSFSERGPRTIPIKSSDAARRSPKRNVRRTKSDSHALPRPKQSSPHPQRKSLLEDMVRNKPSSHPSSSFKRKGVGRTKSESSTLPTSTSQRKAFSPPPIPPPPFLLGESSNHLTLFVDEDKDDEEEDNPVMEQSWQTPNSNDGSNYSSNKPDKLMGEDSVSSFTSSNSNGSAGGKVRNNRTHEVYTGFFLLAEDDDGRAANIKHGFGRTKFPDGRIFEGTYDHGVMIEGKMTYPEDPNFANEERRTYVGKFDLDGFRSGKGIYTTATYTYLGEFHNDEMHGSGILIYHSSDGSKGRNSCRFIGHWKQGLRHGTGKEVSMDGKVLREGLWKKGRFSAGV
mmetsp:Transcript_724/g.1725  ORF Transcript_724/g.1725 Transcript_724/m.1725 type:complete len:710 (+) Transcript_724:138-2267(+)